MNDDRRAVLEAELADVDVQIAQLEAVRAFLRQRLGLQPDPGNGGPGPGSGLTPPGLDSGDGSVSQSGLPSPALAVKAGEFFGYSATKATVALLERIGRTRPLATKEIFEAIRKGGVTVGSTGILYKSLTRDSRFFKPSRGVWGLASWYPAAARKGREADPSDQSDPPSPASEEQDSAEGGGETLSDSA